MGAEATTDVVITPADTTVPRGNTVALGAEPRDAAGTPLLDRHASWTSSDPAVALVSDYDCTLILGFSQTAHVFSAWKDMDLADGWQALTAGGGTIDSWSNPTFDGWSGRVSNRCAEPAEPNRLLITISGAVHSDPEWWAGHIDGAIANARALFPTVEQVLLQPVIGGPDHQVCSGNGFRASTNHPVIDEAIALMVGGDVAAGMSPEVDACSDFTDRSGHLTSSANDEIARDIARYYAMTGHAMALAGGIATITATIDGVTGTAAVTVDAAPVASVLVTPATAIVDVGRTVQLEAVPRDSDDDPLQGRPVTWMSADLSIATVDQTGLVTALTPGFVTISATSEGVTGTADITIEPRPPGLWIDVVSSAAVRGTELSWTHTIGGGPDRLLLVTLLLEGPNGNQVVTTVRFAGAELTRAAVVRESGGNWIVVEAWYALESSLPPSGTYPVEIETSGPTVKEIDAGAVSLENAQQDPPEAVSINSSNGGSQISTTISTLSDDAWAFDVVGSGQEGEWTPSPGQSELWQASAGSATAASSTRAAGSAGPVTMTQTFATNSDRSAHIVLVIAPSVPPPPPEPVASVDITPDNVTLEEGESVQLDAQPRDAAGNPLSRPVTWASNDPSVASVDAGGRVTAGSAGNATITATSEGIDGTASITVTTPQMIRFDAASSGATRGTSLSWLHSIGDGTDRILVVGVGMRIPVGSNTTLTVRYDGVDLTYAGSARSGPVLVETWYALEATLPAFGTHSVDIITSGGDVRELNAGAVSLEGANQGPPDAMATNTVVQSAMINTSVTTYSENAWLIDAVAAAASGGWTPGAAQTERWDETVLAASAAASTMPVATTGATTVTQTFNSVANRAAHVVLAVAPAGAPPPPPAIAFDAASNVSDRNTSLAWSHSIGGGADRLLVVGVGVRIPAANQTIVTVRYAGVDLTRAGTARNGPILTELWYALEDALPVTGTHTVEITTVGGDVKELNAGAVSVSGAAQTAPEALATNTVNQSTAIDTDVTTLTNNAWVFDVVGAAATGTWTPGAAQTERWDETVLAASAAGSTRPVAPAGLTTITQAFEAIANRIAHVVMAVAPAP